MTSRIPGVGVQVRHMEANLKKVVGQLDLLGSRTREMRDDWPPVAQEEMEKEVKSMNEAATVADQEMSEGKGKVIAQFM